MHENSFVFVVSFVVRLFLAVAWSKGMAFLF
jgi:hypothetical protein